MCEKKHARDGPRESGITHEREEENTRENAQEKRGDKRHVHVQERENACAQ